MQVYYDFKIEYQKGNRICWAAVAVAASHFYDHNSQWTQCKLVEACGQGFRCCPMEKNGPCDNEYLVDKGLMQTRNYWDIGDTPNLGFDRIFKYLKTGHVICAQVSFPEGGTHVVVVHGCSDANGRQMVAVADSLFACGWMDLERLTNYFERTGRWDQSYLTKHVETTALIDLELPKPKLGKKIKRLNQITEKVKIKNSEGLEVLSQSVCFLKLMKGLTIQQSPIERVASRSIVIHKNKVKAIEENGINSADQLFVIDDKNYLKKMQTALRLIKTPKSKITAGYELRLLLIPQLQTQGLWLHYSASVEKDVMIVMVAGGSLQEGSLMPASIFYKELEKTRLAIQIN